jgi:hypothetical protein
MRRKTTKSGVSESCPVIPGDPGEFALIDSA